MTFFEGLPAALQSVRTRPLFVMRLTVAPLQNLGIAPGGGRRLGVIVGGTFEGERLSGAVQPGGADWQGVHPDGTTTLDVRVPLQTNDGALIAMRYTGLRHGPPEVMARLAAGEPVDPADYYFRTTATFETASPDHAWLNRVLAIGTGHRLPEGPVYSLFELL
jgi:hypothetical protein